MQWLIWTVCGVLAVLWTGTIGLTALIIDWTAGSFAQVDPSGVSGLALPAAAPGWLSPWIDSHAWAAFAQALEQPMLALRAALPTMGALADWLTPLVWVLWGFGMVSLLAAAFFVNWLVHRGQAVLKVNP